MNPYLSIIIPIYNIENYLKVCIDSVLQQTFNDFEVILVDDGSPDGCPAICDEYVAVDERLRVIHKQNGGLVSARKAGVKAARGEYIGFVDGDDWIDNNMYAEMCAAAKKYNADIVQCGLYREFVSGKRDKVGSPFENGFYDKQRMIETIYPKMIFNGLNSGECIMPGVVVKIIKTEIVMKNLPVIPNTISIGEDMALTYPCYLDANSVYLLTDRYFYYYRQITESMTYAYKPGLFEKSQMLVDLLCKASEEKGVYDIAPQVYSWFEYNSIVCVKNEFISGSQGNASEKLKFIGHLCNSDSVVKAFNIGACTPNRFNDRLYFWLIRHRMALLLFVISKINSMRNGVRN
jgi:glycosyltransferase involved in cell wall biosynthesis